MYVRGAVSEGGNQTRGESAPDASFYFIGFFWDSVIYQVYFYHGFASVVFLYVFFLYKDSGISRRFFSQKDFGGDMERKSGIFVFSFSFYKIVTGKFSVTNDKARRSDLMQSRLGREVLRSARKQSSYKDRSKECREISSRILRL